MLNSALSGFFQLKDHILDLLLSSWFYNWGKTIWLKSDEELLVELVANQDQYILAVAIVFASTVVVVGVVIVELISHEEKVRKIRDSCVYMEIINYMLDSALSIIPLKHYIFVSVIVKNIEDSPPDLIIEERQSGQNLMKNYLLW